MSEEHHGKKSDAAVEAGAPESAAADSAPEFESKPGTTSKPKVTARLWAAVVGAPVKLWAALSGTAAKLKATGQKVFVACTSWWKKRSKRAKVGLIAGGGSALVAIGVAVFLVLFLRPVFVVEAVEAADAVVVGENVVLSAEVVNEGRTSGDCRLRALVDGKEVKAELVSLDPGARQKVSFTLSALPAGRYDVALAQWPQLAQKVWVMTPAKLEMGAVRVQPNPMDINTSSEAKVLVGLTNTGEAPGSYDLAFSVDGKATETRKVEVKGGVSIEESFALKVAKPGSCKVAVNGESVDVPVYKLGRPKNGEVLAKAKIIPLHQNLNIKNNDDMDCVIVLTEQDEDRPYNLTVYVRAKSECKTRVMDGTYKCSYSFGKDWCTYRKEFTSGQWRGEFAKLLKLTGSSDREVENGTWISTTRYTVITMEVGGASGESLSISQAATVKRWPYVYVPPFRHYPPYGY